MLPGAHRRNRRRLGRGRRRAQGHRRHCHGDAPPRLPDSIQGRHPSQRAFPPRCLCNPPNHTLYGAGDVVFRQFSSIRVETRSLPAGFVGILRLSFRRTMPYDRFAHQPRDRGRARGRASESRCQIGSMALPVRPDHELARTFDRARTGLAGACVAEEISSGVTASVPASPELPQWCSVGNRTATRGVV